MVSSRVCRPSRATAVASVTVTLGLALSGCQGYRADSAAPTSGTEHPSSTQASGTAVPRQYDTTLEGTTPYLVPRAVSRYGAARVRAGTDLAMAFERDYAFNERLISATAPDELHHMMAAGDQMVRATSTEWRRNVRKFASTQDHSKQHKLSGKIASVALYDMLDTSSGAKDRRGRAYLPDGGPVLINPRFKAVRTDIVENYLWVKVVAAADLRVQNRGKARLMKVRRTMRYWLVSDRDRWKISAWRGLWRFGAFRPDK